MEISEKELEDYLFSHNGENAGIPAEGILLRQVNIEGYGVMDLLHIEFSPDVDGMPNVYIKIIELKKDVIDSNAIGQICRYKKGVERAFELFSKGKHGKHFKRVEIEGMLLGRSINDNNDVGHTIDAIDWLTCKTYSLSIVNGIEFEDHANWYRVLEDFSSFMATLVSSSKSDYINHLKESVWEKKHFAREGG